jgi:hypothetical protein
VVYPAPKHSTIEHCDSAQPLLLERTSTPLVSVLDKQDGHSWDLAETEATRSSILETNSGPLHAEIEIEMDSSNSQADVHQQFTQILSLNSEGAEEIVNNAEYASGIFKFDYSI